MDQECASSKFGGQEMLDEKPIKVSELISELNDILIEFGDLDCYRCDDTYPHEELFEAGVTLECKHGVCKANRCIIA